MKRLHFAAAIFASLPLAWSQTTAPIPRGTLAIHLDKAVGKSSPMLHGLMTEEINYSYDGGLYAELVRNRTFQDDPAKPVHWAPVQESGKIEIDKTTGPSAALPLSLKVDLSNAAPGMPAGAKNEGFWGIATRPYTSYKASFYAKADASFTGPLAVLLVDDATGRPDALATIPKIATAWTQYTVTLKTEAMQPTAATHFVIQSIHPGTLWLQLVSLFPPTYANRANGNRSDIMEMLADMKPMFLRLPGGNYLEGDHIPERYEWKKTIGPLVDRPTHPSPWGYRSSDGLGLLEFLDWCEDLHMQPLLAVYAGYSMKQEHIDPGPALQPYVQDALDEIEYVTGPVSTKWGAERAKDGHPKPFPLTYVEIGNEDWFDKSKSYDGRFAQFYDAIKKAYPKLQLIATTPVTSRKADLLDDHFYKKAQQFFDDVHRYDKTPRDGTKIMVGEWATREGEPTPNFMAALGDAAWMTGMERNSDVILMHSYAPLFVNVNPGGMQWKTNLIGYDASTSYGSPSYYAQMMFSTLRGTEILETELAGADKLVFESVTKDPAKGLVYVKLVNASDKTQRLTLDFLGAKRIQPDGEVVSLRAISPTETNTIEDPTHIVPASDTFSGVEKDIEESLPPYSIEVLTLHMN